MRLLDRYLLRELCAPLAYCLAGFLIFWISFDLFSGLDEFQKAQMTGGEIAHYYLVRTPELLVTVLPVAFLLALLYSLTNHGRHNEIIAMRAAGLSLGRISVAYLTVGLLMSLVLLYLNERLVPDSGARAEALKTRHVSSDFANAEWASRINFRNARENRIWNIGALNRKTFEMIDPHVEWLLPDGTRKQLIAKRAGWTNEHWMFYDVELFAYEPNVDFDKAVSKPFRTNVLAMPELRDKPEEIQLLLKFQHINAIEAAKRTQLSLEEINYLRRHLELNARDHALLETQYHARLAQPWTCIVVALVALPFGARANSRRNVMVEVASSIFIVFAYFILLRVGLALGTGGYVPPWLAAWLPNTLFATVGLLLTWRSK
jgi:lipopolysaccharide export system permease protein